MILSFFMEHRWCMKVSCVTLILTLCVVTSSLFAQPQQPPPSASEASQPKYKHSQENKEATAPSQPPTSKTITPIKNVTPRDQENANNNKTHGDDKTPKDWWLILFTGLLVIVGFLQAKILWNQLSYHRLMERAYVYVTIETRKEEPLYDKHKGHQGFYDFSAHIGMWNHGKTPAIINNIRAVICLDEAVIPEIKEYRIPPGLALGSNHGNRTVYASKIINETERKNIFEGNTVAYCCGRVDYKDIFGKEQHTGFCWEHRITDSGPEWVISHKYESLNYYT